MSGLHLLDIASGINCPNRNARLVAGGAVSKVDPSSTGLNPAWRQAGAHAVFGITWPDGASAALIQSLRDDLEKRLALVRALAPESGAYFNEVRVRCTFWGAECDANCYL